jgi:hypothetical protein
MDLQAILTNIERRLAVLKISANEASRRAGHPDAIRNLQRKVLAGTRGSLRADTLAALAAALKTTSDELARPARPAATPPAAGMREYLLAQRDLIDRQLAAMDEAEIAAKPVRKRKKR